jgi:uncharacterized protein YjbJ (UPF0337 family)
MVDRGAPGREGGRQKRERTGMVVDDRGTAGARDPSTQEVVMSADDKMKHNAEDALGKAKEKLGESTDDPTLEKEGKAEQSKVDLKKAGEKVKDAFR